MKHLVTRERRRRYRAKVLQLLTTLMLRAAGKTLDDFGHAIDRLDEVGVAGVFGLVESHPNLERTDNQ